MLKQLAEEASNNTEFAKALEEVLLQQCKIKLVVEEKKKGEKKTFAQRIKKSHFEWSDLLHIVSQQQELMEVFKKYSRREDAMKEKVVNINKKKKETYLHYRLLTYGAAFSIYWLLPLQKTQT